MAITRRNLLRATGIGAGVAVAGALAGWDTAGPKAEPPGGQVDWEGLHRRLTGTLNLPSDTGYATAKLAYNPAFDDRQPAAVAQCGGVSDVQACIDVAATARIPVAARSGGHSYAGYSTPDNGLGTNSRR